MNAPVYDGVHTRTPVCDEPQRNRGQPQFQMPVLGQKELVPSSYFLADTWNRKRSLAKQSPALHRPSAFRFFLRFSRSLFGPWLFYRVWGDWFNGAGCRGYVCCFASGLGSLWCHLHALWRHTSRYRRMMRILRRI